MSAKSDRTGRSFERRVAAIYRSLGADVIHNVDVAGSQIDLLVEESTPSGLPKRLAIECKDLSSNVGIDIVRASAIVAEAVRRRVDTYVIVASSGFTEKARILAHDNGIHLLTIGDIETRSPMTSVGAQPGVNDRLVDAAQDVIRNATVLTEHYGDVLNALGGIGDLDLGFLSDQAEKVLQDLRSVVVLHRDRSAEASSRRFLAALVRLGEGVEGCIDAARYLKEVTEVAGGIDDLLVDPPLSEADRTSASFLAVRERTRAIRYLRSAIARLRDTCERLDWSL